MEVVARLEFTTPCLGNVRHADCDLMQRDRDGNVIFMPSWWHAAFSKAAKAINRYHRLIDKIHPSLQVEGAVTRIKRYYGGQPAACKLHEGFDIGAVVTFRFILPHGMTLEQFTELLETVGDYICVSPYGWQTGNWGHFKVLEVKRRARSASKKSGQPATSNPSPPVR